MNSAIIAHLAFIHIRKLPMALWVHDDLRAVLRIGRERRLKIPFYGGWIIMSQTSGLTVRQHEREGINVPVEFIICDEHKPQVHFSSSSSALGQHAIKAMAMDISPGGMGLETRQFIPRMCEGILRVLVPDAIQIADQATPVYVAAFEHRAKVRRVFLTGRDPIYTVGVAFVNPGPEMDDQITKLLKLLNANGNNLRMRPIAGSVNPAHADKGERGGSNA